MVEYLFAYGTLQKEKVQKELFVRLLNGTKDQLMGYKASPIEITDPDVLAKSQQKFHLIASPSPLPSDSIQGTVYEVSIEELEIADAYEPEEYHRVHIHLKSGKLSWIYVKK